MEIKCKKCNKTPKIEVFDDIQSIKFICDSTNYSHYGLFSINNFYNAFMTKYEEELSNFIKRTSNNINATVNFYNEFAKFQEEFDKLLSELKIVYENLKEHINKILFIKNIIYSKGNIKNNHNEIKNQDYYNNKDIIAQFKKLIKMFKQKILIKEKNPPIKINQEISKNITEKSNNFENIESLQTDIEFINYNLNINNICIKKKVKFEVENNDIKIIRHRKLLKLNNLSTASFIYSYTKRIKQVNSSFIEFYDNNLNLLFRSFIDSHPIREIIQLKDNSLMLFIKKDIIIINLDIVNKCYKITQILKTEAKQYIEAIISKNNKNISLLIPIQNQSYFFSKNLNNNDKINYYKNQEIKIKLPVTYNAYSINPNNFINTSLRLISFYTMDYKENTNIIEINENGKIITKEYLNSGIYLLNENEFILCGLNNLYLISFPYKEIIAIYRDYSVQNIFTGYYGELYLFMTERIGSYRIIRQVHINEDNIGMKGEIVDVGYAFLDRIDSYERYNFVDLGNSICYIKINQEEEEEIENGARYYEK